MKTRNKILITVLAVFIALGVVAYNKLTLFVVQPIGALPEGVTLVIRQSGQLEFIDSADALCERTTGKASLLCRAAVLGKIAEEKKIYAKLPYNKWLYSRSFSGNRIVADTSPKKQLEVEIPLKLKAAMAQYGKPDVQVIEMDERNIRVQVMFQRSFQKKDSEAAGRACIPVVVDILKSENFDLSNKQVFVSCWIVVDAGKYQDGSQQMLFYGNATYDSKNNEILWNAMK